jgi:hypothetical protein
MPLFMALHENLPQGTTANDVADYHAKDVSTHGEYGVKYLNLWIDEGSAAAHGRAMSAAPGRHYRTAIGLRGEPVPPTIRSGAAMNRNSQRPAAAHVCPRSSSCR